MGLPNFGVVNTPVYRASTILYPGMAAIKANTQPYTYGRRGTPSTRSFEDAISNLEGAAKTVSVTSGVQAIGLAILSAEFVDRWLAAVGRDAPYCLEIRLRALDPPGEHALKALCQRQQARKHRARRPLGLQRDR